MKADKTARPLGRPRSFDPDKALEAALKVFWSKGYEGTSLSDLTEAMGINRPSLYAAFGDKAALFRKALDRYAERQSHFVHEALNQPTAKKAVERLLLEVVKIATNSHGPRGCLMVQESLACGDSASCIREEVIARGAANEALIRERLKRAKGEGDLPANADPADLARFTVTLMSGIAVRAAGGASRAELERVVATSLRAWPR